MRKRNTWRLGCLAILTVSVALLAGCATSRPAGKPVVLLDGRHVTSFSRSAALASGCPAITNAGSVCERWVYVVTDRGMDMMYGIEVKPGE